MNIRCRKIDCLYNKSATCNADNINVSRDGTCSTYKKDKDKQDMEMAEELTPTIPNNVPLQCRAGSCLYNHGGRCLANGISVIDNEKQGNADCATFIER